MAGTNNHLGYQLTFQLLSQLNSTVCFMKWQWQMLVKLNHYQNSCLCSDEQLIRKWNFLSAFQKLMNPIIILISGIMYSFTDQLTMRLLIQHKISSFCCHELRQTDRTLYLEWSAARGTTLASTARSRRMALATSQRFTKERFFKRFKKRVFIFLLKRYHQNNLHLSVLWNAFHFIKYFVSCQ